MPFTYCPSGGGNVSVGGSDGLCVVVVVVETVCVCVCVRACVRAFLYFHTLPV